jgi:hypothetical protein
MPRRQFNDGQEINYNDFNAIGAAIEREMYDRFCKWLVFGTTDAFFGDSFLAVYASATSVTVTPGLGLQLDSAQTTPEPTVRPMYLGSSVVKTITSPDSSNPRWDLLCVKADRIVELTGTRRFKNASSGAITDETMDLQTDWEAAFTIVAGTPAGSPAKPSTPSGYIRIAELYVNAGTGMSGANDVDDTRAIMPIGADATMSTLGYANITAASSRTIRAIMADIDTLLTKARSIVAVSGNVTATAYATHLVDTGAARAITMPAAAAGKWFVVKDKIGTAATYPITMTRAGSEKIDGASANRVLETNWGAWEFVSDGTDWFMV